MKRSCTSMILLRIKDCGPNKKGRQLSVGVRAASVRSRAERGVQTRLGVQAEPACLPLPPPGGRGRGRGRGEQAAPAGTRRPGARVDFACTCRGCSAGKQRGGGQAGQPSCQAAARPRPRAGGLCARTRHARPPGPLFLLVPVCRCQAHGVVLEGPTTRSLRCSGYTGYPPRLVPGMRKCRIYTSAGHA